MKEKKKLGTTEKRLIAACIFLAAAGILLVCARQIPGFAEWYAVHIYQKLTAVVGRVTGLAPFSIVEIGLYVLLILLPVTGVRAVVKSVRFGHGGENALRWASGIFLTVSLLLFLYMTNCGVNYQRESFSEKSGFAAEQYTAEELREVCLWLTEEVNSLAGQVERSDSGTMILTMPAEEEQDAVQAMKKLAEEYPDLNGFYPHPKPVCISEILSYQNLSGVYSPFTIEANYNGDMQDYNIPFTACHELSHLRGFMQEQEANFIAFLACSGSEEEAFAYSGYLMGWIHCMNVLYRADYDAWEEVRSQLPQEAEQDLKLNREFWAEYDGRIAEVSNRVNDTYLKANGQSDGVKSYNRMVDLIVAYYERDGR